MQLIRVGLALIIIGILTSTAMAAEVNNKTLRDYYWNWWLWWVSTEKMISCNWIGLWGLFFFNDNGAMAENCFRIDIKGGRASFAGFPAHMV